MAVRPRLRDTSRRVARRLALGVLDRVARTAERIATRLAPDPFRPLPAAPRGTVDVSPPEPRRDPPPEPRRDPPPPREPPPPDPPPQREPPRPTPIPRREPPRPDPAPRRDPPPQRPASSAPMPPIDTAARIAAAPHVGWAMVDILGRRLEPAIESLRIDLDGADDPALALRTLRVATRRLRAFTRLFAPVLGDATADRLRRRLRKVTRAAGEVRYWDAHLDLVEPLLGRTPDPLQRAALEHVAAWLTSQRRAAAADQHKRLALPRRARIADELADELDRVSGNLLRAGDDARGRIRHSLAACLRPLADRIGPPSPPDEVDRLHAIRIGAKRARYLLELARPAIAEEYRTLRRPAKRVQRTIGRHHDHALLQTLLSQRRDELHAAGHVTLAGALQAMVEVATAGRTAAYTAARPWTEAFCDREVRRFADAIDPDPPRVPPPAAAPADAPPDQSPSGTR